jgi:hypothetical protein
MRVFADDRPCLPPEQWKASSVGVGSPCPRAGVSAGGGTTTIRSARRADAPLALSAQQQLASTTSCGQPQSWMPHAAAWDAGASIAATGSLLAPG